jgi:D-sedoheptulose 7-phosphate isomerase
MNSNIINYLKNAQEAIKKIDTKDVSKLSQILLEARNKEKNIFVFGNGGSAATASHIAGDFLKGISYQLDKRFKIICLNDNIPAMMAISNDLDYSEVFIEQLKAFLNKEDVVIGISGSGNSANVVKALEYANEKQAITIAVCGFNGGKIKQIASHSIHIKINDMEIVEDIHMMVFHAIKQDLIYSLKGKNYSMGKTYDERTKQ